MITNWNELAEYKDWIKNGHAIVRIYYVGEVHSAAQQFTPALELTEEQAKKVLKWVAAHAYDDMVIDATFFQTAISNVLDQENNN